MLSGAEPGRKEYNLWMLFCSASLGKPRVTYGSEDSGGLSLRNTSLGKPRACAKRSFTPSNVDSRCKGNSGQGMKGGHEEGTQNNNKESPLCYIDGHPSNQKYEYILGMFARAISSVEIIWCFMNLYIDEDFSH